MRNLYTIGATLLMFLMLTTICQFREPHTSIATWYGEDYHGKTMANGETFDMYDPTITAANRWEFGTKLLVMHKDKVVLVEVKDRGAFTHDLDLSYAAFEKLENPSVGVINVQIVVLPKIIPLSWIDVDN